MLRCTLYHQGPMDGWQLGDAECELRTDLVLISRSLFVLRRGTHHSCVGALRHIQSAVVRWRGGCLELPAPMRNLPRYLYHD